MIVSHPPLVNLGTCHCLQMSPGQIVDADDHLIKAADFSLTSACPMNGLVTARSALRPQAGQIAVGKNRPSEWGTSSINLGGSECHDPVQAPVDA